MQAIYTAGSGLRGQQTRLDTIAANIANSDTVGYKSSRVDFKDALYSLMDSPVADSEEANLFVGSGVVLGATATDFSNGSMSVTGNLLDFAIQGSGFFSVRNAAGETLYTRNGSFSVSSMDGENRLVTAQGYEVLDAEGNRITVPDGSSDISVSASGVLSTTEGEFAVLGIVSFSNPDGLSAAGDTCYTASEVSGEPETAKGVSIVQGSLENSNVDLAQEMTLLIRSQRAYSLASRALQTADDMEGLANNMR
ncbi:MAG: flagellar hook-basal body protein [Clostridia bacterium]|nr:flagellar hook-basal body protein [Clostridia bacterium]